MTTLKISGSAATTCRLILVLTSWPCRATRSALNIVRSRSHAMLVKVSGSAVCTGLYVKLRRAVSMRAPFLIAFNLLQIPRHQVSVRISSTRLLRPTPGTVLIASCPLVVMVLWLDQNSVTMATISQWMVGVRTARRWKGRFVQLRVRLVCGRFVVKIL